MGDFWGAMDRAYSPLATGLQQGTRKIFGPEATFFPKSWGEPRLPPVNTEDLTLPEVKQAPSGPSTDLGLPSAEDAYEGLQISNMLDLKRLGADLDAGKVKNAPGLADSLGVGQTLGQRSRTVGRTPTFAPEREALDQGPAEFAGPSRDQITGSLPAARRVGPQGPLPSSRPGGSGVVVSSPQEKQPRDWESILGVLGVGLTDIGNALGNPRAPVGGAFYDLMKQKLQAQQMDQLQRRQNMWDDAYKQSQALPQEIYTDPRFTGLMQQKAALDKDMEDGRIDNEKTVSGFLTEMARVKKDLEELQLQTKTAQQLDVENRLATGRAEQEAEQTRKAQEIADNPTAYPEADVARARMILASRKQIFEEDGQQLYMTPTERAQWQQEQDKWKSQQEATKWEQAFKEKDLTQRGELSRMANARQIDARNDTQADREQTRDNATIGAMVENSIKRYAKEDDDGQMLNPDEAVDAALVENENAIVQLAKKRKINFQAPSTGGSGEFYVVNGRQFSAADPKQTAAALRLLYQLSRF